MAQYVSQPLAPAKSALAQRLLPAVSYPGISSHLGLCHGPKGRWLGQLINGGGEQDSAEVQPWFQDPRSPRPFPLRNKSRSSIFFSLHLHVHEFQSEAPIALLPASIYPVFTGGREGHMGARTSLGDMAPSSLFSAGPRLDKQKNPMSPKSLSVRMIGGVPPPSWQTTALHY